MLGDHMHIAEVALKRAGVPNRPVPAAWYIRSMVWAEAVVAWQADRRSRALSRWLIFCPATILSHTSWTVWNINARPARSSASAAPPGAG